MISVVVPTYNEEKNIVSCLKSLNSQSIPRKDYEIIVVDGHSMDKTVELAKKHADKVIMQKSKGVGGARNDGVDVAKHELIATTDSDCIVPENWLENIIKAFDKDEDCIAVYGSLEPSDGKYKYHFKLANALVKVAEKMRRYHMCGANTAFKKKYFLKCGGYFGYGASDDWEISFRIKKYGKILYDENIYVYYSTRRVEKNGLVKCLCEWVVNDINTIMFKKDIKEYARQNYK